MIVVICCCCRSGKRWVQLRGWEMVQMLTMYHLKGRWALGGGQGCLQVAPWEVRGLRLAVMKL